MIYRAIQSMIAFFCWRVVNHTGAWMYQENSITGYRRAISTGCGYQPCDVDWLRRRQRDKKRAPDGSPPVYGWSGVCFDRDGEQVV